MACVWISLAATWIGGTLGLLLGGLLAGAKRRDVDAAYEQLSAAIHQYLEECAQQDSAHSMPPDRLMVLRRVVSDTDLLAGLSCDEPEAVAAAVSDSPQSDAHVS